MSKMKTVVVLGATGTGKSNLLSWWLSGKALSSYEPSFENQRTATHQYNNTRMDVTYLDTGGLEDCADMVQDWAQRGDAFVLVFDVSKPASLTALENVKTTLQQVKKADLPIVLVGNTATSQPSQVTPEHVTQLTKSLGPNAVYVESSTVSGKVDTVFQTLLGLLDGEPPEAQEKKSQASIISTKDQGSLEWVMEKVKALDFQLKQEQKARLSLQAELQQEKELRVALEKKFDLLAAKQG